MCQKSSLRAGMLLLTSFHLAVRPSAAEYLYFARGGMIQAPARVEGGFVKVETTTGIATFNVSDFAAIVPGGCPDREWPARLERARHADAVVRFSEVWWALQNGLIPEAVAAIREFAKLDPDYAPMARLTSALDRLDRPVTDPDTTRLQKALGVDCRELRGSRILLLHQHDETTARARLDLLEHIVMAYHLWLAGMGIDVRVPSERLVSVYFARRSDYLEFLNSQSAGAFRSTLGYYHPNFKAVVCFDARRITVSTTNGSHSIAGEAARKQLLQEFDAPARDHGTAAHEMIHLLVTETELEPRPGAFPHWFHEGFAAQFEVVRGGRWAGIGRVHDLRLPELRKIAGSLNLADLVHDAGYGHGYRRDLYARSWALVYFLRQTRPQEFAAFLDLLRVPTTAKGSEPIDSAFITAFSRSPAALEAECTAFMNRLQAPLEANGPVKDRSREGVPSKGSAVDLTRQPPTAHQGSPRADEFPSPVRLTPPSDR